MNTVKSTEPFHLKHRNLFVGVFLILPVVLVVSAVIFTIGKQKWSEKWTNLTVTYDRKTGLSKSSNVTFQGIQIGNVESVQLTMKSQIIVTFKINQLYAPLIKKDSKATLASKSLLVGDAEIELTRGSDSIPMVADGDSLAPGYPVDMTKTIGDVTKIVADVQLIVAGIAQGKGTVGQLLTNDTLYRTIQLASNDIRKVLATTNATIANVNTQVSTLGVVGKSSAILVDSLTHTVAQVNSLMKNVDSLARGVQPLSGDVKKTMAGLQRDLGEVETLLKALQKHWIIRKEVKKVKDGK